MISKNIEKDTFQKFGGTIFQTKLLQSLLLDLKFFTRIFTILKKEYFTTKAHQYLFEKIYDYYEKYKLIPTLENLEIIITSEEDEILRNAVYEIFRNIKKSAISDTKMIKDEALSFCRQQKMKTAIFDAIEKIKKNDYEGIYKEIGDALKAGEETDDGHIYFDELEHRLEKLKREVIPTGLKDLDILLNGGMGKGELLVITAGPGVGKSFIMAIISSNVILQGKNVIYYTLELYEHQIGVRFDSKFSGIPIDNIEANKDVVRKKLDDLKKNNKGKLIIKEYATKTASVNTLRMHLNKQLMKNFIPDLIVVDYADSLKGRKGINEKRFELESIYEDLRAMAFELNVPVITGCQVNRQEFNNEIITIASMAESWAKAAVADVIVTISRRMDDKLKNRARMYLAKNRAGKDGIIIPLEPFDIGCMLLETKNPITDIQDVQKEIEKIEKEEKDIIQESLAKKYQKFKNKGNRDESNYSDT